MAKYFKSKKIKRKKWIVKCILFVIIIYIFTKVCIYSLVNITPSKFLSPSLIFKDCYKYIKDKTLNSPLNLLNYQGNNDGKLEFVTSLDKKKVYIYNTHQGEEYNDGKTVVDSAYYFKKKLFAYDIEAKVEEGSIEDFLNINNYSYNYSYVASRYFIENELSNDYDLIIDLHRDAVSRKNSIIEINGKNYARLMFVIGKKNKNYKENYNIVLSLNKIIETKYPGLSRGVLLQDGANVNGIYNQDLASNIILIELGGNHNQFNEVKNTIDLLAPIIGEYLYGNEIQDL